MKPFLSTGSKQCWVTVLSLSLAILLIIVGGAQGRDLFYVLDRTGSYPDYSYHVKCYDLTGVFQHNTLLGSPTDGDYTCLATNGSTAWIASQEANLVRSYTLRTAAAGSTFSLQTHVPPTHGGCTGMAVAGSALYISRSLTWGTPTGRIELYGTNGTYADTWNTLSADALYPGSLQYVGGDTLIAEQLTNANAYFLDISNSGTVFSSFVTNESTSRGLCANASTVWIMSPSSLAAYDYSGNRQPSLDATFSGVLPSQPLDVYYASGPDEGIASVAPMDIDYGSIVTGGFSQQTVQIENVGNADLTITGLSLTDTTNFSASSITLPQVLSPGQSISPVITFNPASPGSFPAEYVIDSSDQYNPQITVALEGEGVSAIRYVSFSADPGGDGMSWETAFSSLNEAMADAGVLAGTEIRVLEGQGPGGQAISKSVSVYGGYNQFDERNVQDYETFLDAGRASGCLAITAANVRIDGIGFTGGNAAYGGGISIEGDNATIHDCIMDDNVATYGAGIRISESTSTATLSNCSVTNNRSHNGAAGIYNQSGGTLTIQNTRIINNECFNGGGGGLYNSSSTCVVEKL